MATCVGSNCSSSTSFGMSQYRTPVDGCTYAALARIPAVASGCTGHNGHTRVADWKKGRLKEPRREQDPQN